MYEVCICGGQRISRADGGKAARWCLEGMKMVYTSSNKAPGVHFEQLRETASQYPVTSRGTVYN